ncbi:MAG: hypothetical protein AAGC85_23180, partial [Bacteroidota bacterium]
GEVYVLNAFESSEDGGKIYKLTRDGETTFNPPKLLSETKAFKNLETLEPADELIPYKVNSPLWSDGAAKKRWIVIPNDGTYNTSDEQVLFDENDEWDFPVGTVFIKHFDLPLDQRNPSITQKLETRFVILGPNNWVGGITYKWNEDGTDAILLEAGDSQVFTVLDKEGNPFSQIWDFPSRGQCLTCHNTNAKSVLGLKTHQLNGDLTYPSTGITDNQLRTWSSLGIFANGPLESAIPSLPKSVPVDDPHASLDLKISSYLDANCSHCHRPGGVITSFDARFQSDLDKLMYAPTQSTASAEGSQIVIPGDAFTSMLRIRDAAEEEGAMPPLARNIVDQVYIDTLTAWINSLDPDDYEIPCTEPTIDRLVWVNSDTDEIIGDVPNGGTINMYERNHSINIVAIVDNCPETVGSVRFFLNGPTTLNRAESTAPYVLAGDNAGDYEAWNYQLGSYTLIATPYSEKGTEGIEGTPISVSFDIVIEDSAPCEVDPPSLEAGENVVLACDGSPSTITAIANEAGSFSWFGPNDFYATTDTINVREAGIYTVSFTNILGCTASDTVEVFLAEYDPVSSIPTTVNISCETGEANLNVVASQYDSISWSGPDGFTADVLNPNITLAGTYTISLLKGEGCSASYSLTAIYQDSYSPIKSIPSQLNLSCEQVEDTIRVIAAPYTSVSWSGPEGFSSSNLSPAVSTEGTYTLQLTYGASCVETASVQVQRETDSFNPFVSFPINITLACDEEGRSIPVSLGDYASLSWTGPEGFSSTDISPFVNRPGTYSLTVNSEGGCSDSISVSVTLDDYDPVISLPAVVELDCITGLSSITTEMGSHTSLEWSGPNNFQSTDKDIEVQTEGVYTLLVRSVAGCAQQYEVLVEACPDECEVSTIASLIIVNADNNEDVLEIQDGAIYNLNDFGHNIAIRAEEDACTFEVKSVKMILSGAQDFSRTESKAPWALFGDRGGDFSPWVAKAGSYSLIATPYSEKGAMGTVGFSKEVTFSLTNPQSWNLENDLENSGESRVYVAPNKASKFTYLYIEGKNMGLVEVEVISILGVKTLNLQATKETYKSQLILPL